LSSFFRLDIISPSLSLSFIKIISSMGMGGRTAQHDGTLSSYIVKQIALQKVSEIQEDPRQALLKYAKYILDESRVCKVS
jgi:hypothetical protein